MTQEAIADESGVDRATWSLMERGIRAPALTALWRIAGALQLQPHQLVASTQDEYEAATREPLRQVSLPR